MLGITFLLIAVRGTNIREILVALESANYWLALPLLGTLAALYWVRSVRWSVLLNPLREDITARDVFPAVMIGFASAIVLPPPLGDVVRMYIVGKQLQLKNTAVLATIILERFFDLMTIVLLVCLALILLPKPAPELASAGYVVGGLALFVLGVVAVYVMWTDLFLSHLRRLFSLLPDRIGAILQNQIALLDTGLMALRSRRQIAVVSALAAVQWGLMTATIYISMVAIGITVDLSAAFVVLAFVFAGVAIPSTPGAVGTIQLSFTLALAPFGVPSGSAVAASVFWHVLVYCLVVSLGLYFFVRMGFSVTDIREHAKVRPLADGP